MRRRPSRDVFTVGVHAKSVRANMAPLQVIDVLAEVVPGLADARLRVDVHPEVADPAAHCFAPEVLPRLRELAARGLVDLRVHDYFEDDELWAYLQELTCRCCRTGSALIRAGWRPASTWGRRCARPRVASTPNNGRA
ncbi:hypothetical protein [Streptomyces sp. TLI_235]|uniref:hypothetical protein n=1 Tax=Kitasatospora sp. NPDC085879 TaxID=3154769 RepID=UPI00211CE2A2|nr:hypothetical protein [Streptomyces sp. TLI_235]